jgi:hypothetical protein
MISSVIIRKWRYRGLLCEVILNKSEMSEWYCGYVAVERMHPYWGKNYDAAALSEIDIHGGLTFSSRGEKGSRWKNRKLWWLGFDCSHAWDETYTPEAYHKYKLTRNLNAHRWIEEEVIHETEKLAEQLVKVVL